MARQREAQRDKSIPPRNISDVDAIALITPTLVLSVASSLYFHMQFALLSLFMGLSVSNMQTHTLPNGLRVVIVEDQSTPLAAVQVWYHVGSQNEDPTRQGFAHMFEHMMFRGTDQLGPTGHFEKIKSVGGQCNAFTSFDKTVYENQVPANQLRLALWLEAERMAKLNIDPQGFHTERKVVEEERRISSLNKPYGTVIEQLAPSLFPDHPYRWLPIGNIPQLRAAKIEELQRFWEQHYVPNNAIIVIVGPVPHTQALRDVEALFGWIPSGPPHVAIAPAKSEIGPKTLKIKEEHGPLNIVGVGYRTVPFGHPDELALDVLALVLDGGDAGRLHQDLVKTKKIAPVAKAIHMTMESGGLMGWGAGVMPLRSSKRVLKLLQAYADTLKTTPITDAELLRAKNTYVQDHVASLRKVKTTAEHIGNGALLLDDPNVLNTRLQKVMALTAQDLKKIAQTYFVPERHLSVSVEPTWKARWNFLLGKTPAREGDSTFIAAAESKPNPQGPKAHAIRPAHYPKAPPIDTKPWFFNAPNTHEKTLSNGLRVVVIPDAKIPWVTARLMLPRGRSSEPTPGVAAAATTLLTRGTSQHSSQFIAQILAEKGLALDASALNDNTAITLDGLSHQWTDGLSLMGEVIHQPTFPADELKIYKKTTKAELSIMQRSGGALADVALAQTLFGADHPYGQLSTGGSRALNKLTPDLLRSWWKQVAQPQHATLYVVGAVAPEEVWSVAEKAFAAWIPATQPLPSMAAAPLPGKPGLRIVLVDQPGAVQSQIRMGQVSVPPSDTRWMSLRLLTEVLGGSFTSRINRKIRIEKGLTYGAHASNTAYLNTARTTLSTYSKTSATAETMRTLLDETQRIQTEPPTQNEVDTSIASIQGNFAAHHELQSAWANTWWTQQRLGKAHDAWQQDLNALHHPMDFTQRIPELLPKDAWTIVVVGDAKKIKHDLQTIAPVEMLKLSF